MVKHQLVSDRFQENVFVRMLFHTLLHIFIDYDTDLMQHRIRS